jgi:hypothetical protein
LDESGRCVAKNRRFKSNLDVLGRPWTARRALQNLMLPLLGSVESPRCPIFYQTEHMAQALLVAAMSGGNMRHLLLASVSIPAVLPTRLSTQADRAIH